MPPRKIEPNLRHTGTLRSRREYIEELRTSNFCFYRLCATGCEIERVPESLYLVS